MEKKVYIVEDEAHIRQIIELKVRSIGFEVSGFCDGASALAAIRQDVPDLIVTDYRMPGEVNGADLIRALNEQDATKDIPIILLTGSLAVLKQIKEDLAGVRRVIYMTKPFSPRVLAAEIHRLLLAGAVEQGL